MLSIGRLAGGTERYYTDAVARGQEDYYTGRGEAPGAWLGGGATAMGLSGRVEEDEFTTLLRGQDREGAPLRSRIVKTKVPAYDLTFSAPKSVSVLYGIGPDDVSAAARDAHDDAVCQAIGYLERHAAKVRRGHAGRRLLPADGLTVASFRHRTSRAGDPQLHTHAIVANLGFADGKWSGLDSRSLYAHARTAGYLYQAALRDQLTRRLGVEWEPIHNGMAEVRGVDPTILRHFSRRRIEIEEHLHQLGRRTRRSGEIAALDTRRAKERNVPADSLRADWRARAAELGFGRREVSSLLGRRRPSSPDATELAATARRLAGPGGVTRNASTFDRRDALREWAASHRQGAPVVTVEQLTDTWLQTAEVIPLQFPSRRRRLGGERYTTEAMLAAERELIDSSWRRRSAGVAIADAAAVETAITSRPSLAREQALVVRGLTRSGDGVQVVRAAAGTGKTYALDAARDAWEQSGHVVVGCALSARAAVELEQQAGIRSETVARLQQDLGHGYGLAPNSVLVVDEAGMVGSRELASLSQHADRAGAKLVLVGDDRQLPEIDAGGALSGIAKRIGALELREVRRQREGWDREALDDLRHGRVDAWAQRYRDHGRLQALPTAAAARDTMAHDWWSSARDAGTDAVMIAHRRKDVEDLNKRARELMRVDGRLGEVEVKAGGREFAEGDRVLTRRNDRRLGVVNGSRGVVREVDRAARTVTVTFDGGKEARLDADYLDVGHLDHAYALTAHAAQGATVDKAFILGTDDTYREWGYTALTRHRDEARFYVVSDGRADAALPGLEPSPDPLLEDVRATLGSSRQQELAHDVGDPTVRPPEADPFVAARNAGRAAQRWAGEAAAVERARGDAELRLGAMEAELEATSVLRRAARADLRTAIAQQRAVVEGWQQRELALGERVAPPPETPAAHELHPPIETAPAPELKTADLGDAFDMGI